MRYLNHIKGGYLVFSNLGHRRLFTSLAASLVLAAAPAYSQRGPASSSGSTSGSTSTPNTNGSRGTSNTPTLGNYPNGNSTNSTNNTLSRPMFLSGRVQFDDGSPANPDIRIERVCNGNTHLETHTDTKGRFYFQVGQEAALDTDASDSSNGRFFGNTSPNSSMNGIRTNGANSSNSLWGCDLQASYPGYRSDTVSLAMRQSMDEPEVGTLVLHRLANVKGSTLSVTTALAPKKAQKDYEKGLQLLRKGKTEEAEKYLSEATDIYPKYAIAWVALGQAEMQQKKTAEARKAFETAITADSKVVSPYDQLALLSAQEGKWQESADFSKKALELNPVEFPSAYWYNALASYNLKRDTDAEKDLTELLKLGGNRRIPQAETMMAQLLAAKGDLSGAATHLKTYLAIAPNATNADLVKQELAKLEGATASAKK